jgi:hypothetical protein
MKLGASNYEEREKEGWRKARDCLNRDWGRFRDWEGKMFGFQGRYDLEG